MSRVLASSLPSDPLRSLRVRVSELRQDLLSTTAAYRKAAAIHNSEQAISLLRKRSRLMRELLETQCQLLLNLRTQTAEALSPTNSLENTSDAALK